MLIHSLETIILLFLRLTLNLKLVRKLGFFTAFLVLVDGIQHTRCGCRTTGKRVVHRGVVV